MEKFFDINIQSSFNIYKMTLVLDFSKDVLNLYIVILIFFEEGELVRILFSFL